jgi:hypothetical protein
MSAFIYFSIQFSLFFILSFTSVLATWKKKKEKKVLYSIFFIYHQDSKNKLTLAAHRIPFFFLLYCVLFFIVYMHKVFSIITGRKPPPTTYLSPTKL